MLNIKSQNGIQEKVSRLKQILSRMDSVLVAFSGGVDSTCLLTIASRVLGSKVLAVTACSAVRPKDEIERAKKFCQNQGIRHILFPSYEMNIAQVAHNDLRRCYFCKQYLFRALQDLAKEESFSFVVDGSNIDDDGMYRPGKQALEESGVRSPLKEAGMTKDDVRAVLRSMGLSVWDLPSQSCLLTRFPYGQEITPSMLQQTQKAEEYLQGLGFSHVRVRSLGEKVSIEVRPDQVPILEKKEMYHEVCEKMKVLGLSNINIDKKGYRTGSMDEGVVVHG